MAGALCAGVLELKGVTVLRGYAVSSLLKMPESPLFDGAQDMLREPQGERKSSIDSGRGSAHAEALEAWGGVFQQAARVGNICPRRVSPRRIRRLRGRR